MDQQSRSIRVTALGFDERMKNALRIFFSGPCKSRCVMVEEDTAEIGIIDLDTYNGEELLNNYRKRYPDNPTIVISLHEKAITGSTFLRKPLNSKELISVMSEIWTKIEARDTQLASGVGNTAAYEVASPEAQQSTTKDERTIDKKNDTRPQTLQAAMYLGEQNNKTLIGTAPDIDPLDPKQVLLAQYNPSDFIQSHLQLACMTADTKNRCVVLGTARGSIYVMPGNEDVLLNISEKQLRTLSMVPITKNEITTTVLESNRLQQFVHDNSIISVNRECLIWKCALWASRGRVPFGTTLNTPVFMSHWPNLTRLMLFPSAMRIAALWVNQPYSLLDTVKALTIPQRNVFGFYSASHALGIASTNNRPVDTIIEQKTINQNKRHNLFGRILKRLHFN